MSQASATTDHNEIRRWVESRNGRPSVVKSTHDSKSRGHGGLLRIDFGPSDQSLEEVDWDEFFETFDENNLAFLYQEKTAAGRKSRFNKFVSRDTVDAQASGREDEDADEDEDEDVDIDDDDIDEEEEEEADEDWEEDDEEDEDKR